EALGNALLLLPLQRRLALEIGLGPVDEALQTALQHSVVCREVALPGAISLLDAQAVQRLHAERLQPVALPRRPDGVEDGGRVLDLGVDLPAELAGKGH